MQGTLGIIVIAWRNNLIDTRERDNALSRITRRLDIWIGEALARRVQAALREGRS